MVGNGQSTDALGACGSWGTVAMHGRMRNACLRMVALNCVLYPMGHMVIGHLLGINRDLRLETLIFGLGHDIYYGLDGKRSIGPGVFQEGGRNTAVSSIPPCGTEAARWRPWMPRAGGNVVIDGQ